MDKYLSTCSSSKINDTQRTKRKYKDEYIAFGFTAIEAEDSQIPFCLVCKKKLSNEALVPSKLKRHLESSHPEVKNKPISYFELLANQQNKSATSFSKYMKIPEKGLIVSYKIAQLIA